MNKSERYTILDAIESIANAIKIGEYPAMEAGYPLSCLCNLFDKEYLLDMIDEEYHQVILDYVHFKENKK